MQINWYPGHMTAARRMMQESLKAIDIVLELRDARLPYSSANPDIDALTKGKERLILLNKVDMADPHRTKLWLEYFAKKNQPAMTVSAVKSQSLAVNQKIQSIMQPKLQRYAERGMNKTVRALVAGIPNAGKSTLINMLCGSARTKTGDRPGVTKGKQWVKAGEYLELMDTPGLLWPRLDNQLSARYLAFTGAINDETMDIEALALLLIETLQKQYPAALSNRYNIETEGTSLELYECICIKRGFLLKGGNADFLRGAKVLIDEFRGGKLGQITLEVPETV